MMMKTTVKELMKSEIRFRFYGQITEKVAFLPPSLINSLEFESWLISFMLPPMWAVNKCYVTLSQLSLILPGWSVKALFQWMSQDYELLHISL